MRNGKSRRELPRARPTIFPKGVVNPVPPSLVDPRVAPPCQTRDPQERGPAVDPGRNFATHRRTKRMAEREPISASRVQGRAMQHLSHNGDVPETMMAGSVPVPRLGKPDNPRCPECRLRWRRTLIRYDYGVAFLGYFSADVCPRGHTYLTEESGDAIEAISIASGLWGRPPPRVWPPRRSRLAARSPRNRRR